MNGDQVLNRLMEGNKRYVAGKLQPKDVKAKREASLNAQNPMATIVTCSDSRIEPAYIFDTNLAELFEIETAGNVIGDMTTGSIEYAVAHLHTPLIMVMGHEKCGAITAAYDDYQGGTITAIVEKIKPCIASVERTDDKAADILKCATANVKAVMKELLERSESVRKAVESGETKLVGAIYYFEDGRVELVA